MTKNADLILVVLGIAFAVQATKLWHKGRDWDWWRNSATAVCVCAIALVSFRAVLGGWS